MKALEKALDQRLRGIVSSTIMQMGFIPGRGTTDATPMVKQLQEKFWEVKKDLFLCFVDLEKVYDRVPRESVYWCLHKRNVPKKLVRLVQATYRNARTVVRTLYGQTEELKIEVGLH